MNPSNSSKVGRLHLFLMWAWPKVPSSWVAVSVLLGLAGLHSLSPTCIEITHQLVSKMLLNSRLCSHYCALVAQGSDSICLNGHLQERVVSQTSAPAFVKRLGTLCLTVWNGRLCFAGNERFQVRQVDIVRQGCRICGTFKFAEPVMPLKKAAILLG